MQTVENAFLDLEFLPLTWVAQHCLAWMGGRSAQGNDGRCSLSAPMLFREVCAGHWFWSDPGLSPFHLSRKQSRTQESCKFLGRSTCRYWTRGWRHGSSLGGEDIHLAPQGMGRAWSLSLSGELRHVWRVEFFYSLSLMNSSAFTLLCGVGAPHPVLSRSHEGDPVAPSPQVQGSVVF